MNYAELDKRIDTLTEEEQKFVLYVLLKEYEARTQNHADYAAFNGVGIEGEPINAANKFYTAEKLRLLPFMIEELADELF